MGEPERRPWHRAAAILRPLAILSFVGLAIATTRPAIAQTPEEGGTKMSGCPPKNFAAYAEALSWLEKDLLDAALQALPADKEGSQLYPALHHKLTRAKERMLTAKWVAKNLPDLRQKGFVKERL